MPCLVDPLTNATCGGSGICNKPDPAIASAHCVCDQFFDESYNCTQTDFFSHQIQNRASSALFMVVLGVLFVLFALELFPDFYYRQGIRAFKKPFSIAKIASLIFILTLALDIAFYLINDDPNFKNTIKMLPLYIVSHTFVIAFMGVLINLIFLSWIEIIERGRSLDNVKWIKPFRIAAIALTVTVITLNALTLPLVLLPSLRAIVPRVNTAKIVISGIFLILIMVASIFALVRGRSLWRSKTVSKMVAFKSRAFISLIVILVAFLIVTLISAFGEASSTRRFTVRMIFNGASVALLVNALIFLQSNLFQKGRIFIGFTSSYNSQPSNRTTGSKSKEIKGPKSRESVMSVSKVEVEVLPNSATTTTTIDDSECDKQVPHEDSSA